MSNSPRGREEAGLVRKGPLNPFAALSIQREEATGKEIPHILLIKTPNWLPTCVKRVKEEEKEQGEGCDGEQQCWPGLFWKSRMEISLKSIIPASPLVLLLLCLIFGRSGPITRLDVTPRVRAERGCSCSVPSPQTELWSRWELGLVLIIPIPLQSPRSFGMGETPRNSQA